VAEGLLAQGVAEDDPMWRLPLWPGYRKLIEGQVADISNAPDSPFGGSITAALFLNRFVGDGIPWVHIDTMAWNVIERPGRPKGGEALGLRALFGYVRERFA
jgi:leucyl aminopeptidase